MEWEREMAYKFREGKAEGLLEGAQQKAEETAIKMLKDNLSTEKIAQYSGLTIEKVLELQSQHNTKA